jgi:hypothetical protein
MLLSFTQTLVAGSVLALGTVVLLRLSLMMDISSAFGAVAFVFFSVLASWFISGQPTMFSTSAASIVAASTLLLAGIAWMVERCNNNRDNEGKEWRKHCASAIALTKE